MIHVVTYATHSEGKFDELVNNKHYVDVVVLGYGTKWTGFNDKLKGIFAYVKTLPDDDVVCFVDGFDTVVQKDVLTLERRFRELDSRVVFSAETSDILKHTVFSPCKDDIIINSGMYIGYVKYLKPILEDCSKLVCTDDQVNMNLMCKKYDYIDIDTDYKLFYNVPLVSFKEPPDACFVSHPGRVITLKKIIRSLKAYIQFFIFPIILIAVALFWFFEPYRPHVILFMFILTLLKPFDTSCINY